MTAMQPGATGQDLSPNAALHREAPGARVRVFDPALCCSSGVCGPEPDAALIRFAADLDWLRSSGVPAQRHNLGQDPGPFAAEPLVRRRLGTHGMSCLPMVLVDGEVLTEGRYPSRAELEARLAEQARRTRGKDIATSGEVTP